MTDHLQKSAHYALSAIESIQRGKWKDAHMFLNLTEEQRVKYWENKKDANQIKDYVVITDVSCKG